MQFIDERIAFDFNTIISNWTEGIFRYDVLLDGEIIFVGNLYATTTPPKIDITDILRNYYNANYDFVSDGFVKTNNNIIREVTVSLYNKEQTDEESMTDSICFIYRQPNYKSYVTTPILDYKNAAGIQSMPMLQGWDYYTNTGYFLPVYPAVSSDVFSFDLTTLHGQTNGNMQISSYYIDGYCPVSNYTSNISNKIVNISMKLSELAMNATVKVDTQVPIDDLFGINPTDNTWTGGTTAGGMKFRATYIGRFAAGYTFTDAYAKHGGTTFKWGSGTTEGTVTTWVNTINYGTASPFNSFSNSDITVTLTGSDGNTLNVKFIKNLKKQNELYANHNDYYTVQYTITYNSARGSLTFEAITIGKLSKYYLPCETDNIKIKVVGGSEPQYTYTIAKFDSKSRYFLKWRDRYGMPQCQPFKGTYTYGEKTTKSNITNYQNIKKLVGVDIVSSWKLNTDWIKEEFYPFYESIFVSPWLQLYDAKEDKVYSVILTDTDYTEKTFKNQNRSLFNLQLEVELDKSQNIIY